MIHYGVVSSNDAKVRGEELMFSHGVWPLFLPSPHCLKSALSFRQLYYHPSAIKTFQLVEKKKKEMLVLHQSY
jgi:hypothetical protein